MNLVKFYRKQFQKYFTFKIWFFKDVLSDKKINMYPILAQPVLFSGEGEIEINQKTQKGLY